MYRAHINGTLSNDKQPKHVICPSCGKIQYDSKALLIHCREKHMHCFICGLNNPKLVRASYVYRVVLCYRVGAPSSLFGCPLSLRSLPQLRGEDCSGTDRASDGGAWNSGARRGEACHSSCVASVSAELSCDSSSVLRRSKRRKG